MWLNKYGVSWQTKPALEQCQTVNVFKHLSMALAPECNCFSLIILIYFAELQIISFAK